MPAALEKSKADMRSSASSRPSTAHSSSVSVNAPPFDPRDLHIEDGTRNDGQENSPEIFSPTSGGVKTIPRYFRMCWLVGGARRGSYTSSHSRSSVERGVSDILGEGGRRGDVGEIPVYPLTAKLHGVTGLGNPYPTDDNGWSRRPTRGVG